MMDEDFQLPENFRELAARGGPSSSDESSNASDDEEADTSITEIVIASDEQIAQWKDFKDWDAPLPESPDKTDIRYRFLKAARRGDVGTAEALLTTELPQLSITEQQLVCCKDGDLYTPLHRASYNGRLEMAEFLLQRGADVLARTDGGWEPLHCAANWGKSETVTLLLTYGANINALTKGNQTPLHLASQKKDPKTMMALLLARNIDISLINDQGDTAYAVSTRSNANNKLFELAESSLGLFTPSGPYYEPRIMKDK